MVRYFFYFTLNIFLFALPLVAQNNSTIEEQLAFQIVKGPSNYQAGDISEEDFKKLATDVLKHSAGESESKLKIQQQYLQKWASAGFTFSDNEIQSEKPMNSPVCLIMNQMFASGIKLSSSNTPSIMATKQLLNTVAQINNETVDSLRCEGKNALDFFRDREEEFRDSIMLMDSKYPSNNDLQSSDDKQSQISKAFEQIYNSFSNENVSIIQKSLAKARPHTTEGPVISYSTKAEGFVYDTVSFDDFRLVVEYDKRNCTSLELIYRLENAIDIWINDFKNRGPDLFQTNNKYVFSVLQTETQTECQGRFTLYHSYNKKGPDLKKLKDWSQNLSNYFK